MVIVGVDEVGRGCWAGPVVAAAVALGSDIAGLKDSKLLHKVLRERLAREIEVQALGYGIGWVEASDIDEIGINAAVQVAMERALTAIKVEYDEIIVDGHINFLAAHPKSRPLIKADATIPAVSAASILAKVARDNFMRAQALRFPGYGFENHVGYGTSAHLAALQALGITKLHRKSYKPIKKFLNSATSTLQ